jgi:hypothetical protein
MKKIEENITHGMNILSLYSDRYLMNKINDNQLNIKLKAEDARHAFKEAAIDCPVAGSLLDVGADIIETSGNITSELEDWLNKW